MMKKLLIAAALLSTTGVALAAQSQATGQPPRGGGLMRADANGDGALTRAEMRSRIDIGFAKLDRNRDGSITPAEIKTMQDRIAAKRGDQGGAQRGGKFARIAAKIGGANGVITADAFRAQAMKRFDRIDANRDGRITAAEMANAPRGRRTGAQGYGSDGE